MSELRLISRRIEDPKIKLNSLSFQSEFVGARQMKSLFNLKTEPRFILKNEACAFHRPTHGMSFQLWLWEVHILI